MPPHRDSPFKTIQSGLTSANDRAFFERVWGTDLSVYQNRVKALGFNKMGRVLDSGCGFGQWSNALAHVNDQVVGIDLAGERLSAARKMIGKPKADKVKFAKCSIERLPFSDQLFDGVFSYSTIQLTDARLSLREIYRVLKPNGLLYINTNDWGWYFYNFLCQHNPAHDFSPRRFSINTALNTLSYFLTGKGKPGASVVLSKKFILKELRSVGFEIMECGGDGSIGENASGHLVSFFPEKQCGLVNVYEVLSRKI